MSNGKVGFEGTFVNQGFRTSTTKNSTILNPIQSNSFVHQFLSKMKNKIEIGNFKIYTVKIEIHYQYKFLLVFSTITCAQIVWFYGSQIFEYPITRQTVSWK